MIFAQAEPTFWPTTAGGWVPLIMFVAGAAAAGWAGVNRIVNAINSLKQIEVHSKEISDVKIQVAEVKKVTDAQTVVLHEIRDGMVTAAEMHTHTQQDAANFQVLGRRLKRIDGRLVTVEAALDIEHPPFEEDGEIVT